METVNVIARGANVNAFTGNTETIALGVCVTRQDGEPVTGLKKAHFTARTIVAAGTGVGPINFIIDHGANGGSLPGFYTLFLPIKDGKIWGKGDYIFAVVIKKGSEGSGHGRKGDAMAIRGQTLAKLSIVDA